MLIFSEPQLKDCDWISKCVKESGYMGSDASFANIYPVSYTHLRAHET